MIIEASIVTALFREPSTQWLTVACLVGCLAAFLILKHPGLAQRKWWQMAPADLWLAAAATLVLLRYACAYQTASLTLQVTSLMAGMVAGKGVATWVNWRAAQAGQRTGWVAGFLVCLFTGAALWRPKIPVMFQYHGIPRWQGFWENPNWYGLCMGAGLVLATGMAIRAWRMEGGRRMVLIWHLLAAAIMGFSLYKSYSRGAWLGTAAGLFYLAVRAEKSSKFSAGWQRNRLALVVLASALALLAFWHLRFSETRPAQRIISVANANDFSWRNRVAAWDGARRMMTDRPLTGFGWVQSEAAYQKNYLRGQADEYAAIQLNDFFMLGISAGVPALVCFAIYLGLALTKKSAAKIQGSPSPAEDSSLGALDWLKTVCRAGAIVLLAGFWFDGGLFKLSVGPVFWILLELSRLESAKPSPAAMLEPAAGGRSKNEIWLRRVAWILAGAAILQTAAYLGTPFLPVNRGTLAFARKYLIPARATGDFDFLAAQPIWRGEKLKALLEHVDLANYNRQLVRWPLEETMYQEYVLSPVIGPAGDFGWRRRLWEEFYPRIRHESSPAEAATIIVRHLRERVSTAATPPHDIPVMWEHRLADRSGFEAIYVAALRSVGVPARLDVQKQAEFWDGSTWLPAPRPPVAIANPAKSLPELRQRLDAFFNQPRFSRALWGVKIQSLDMGHTLYENNADRLMSPASNSKLYAGALALDALGGDHRFTTTLRATTNVDAAGTLNGSLIVSGSGDPGWKATNFWDIFEPFIAALTNARVQKVAGDLVMDDTFFRGPTTGSGWAVEDLTGGEGAEISALTLEDNTAEIRVGPGENISDPGALTLRPPDTGLVLINRTRTVKAGRKKNLELQRQPGAQTVIVYGEIPMDDPEEVLKASVPEPALWFGTALKEALARRGIPVAGNVRCLTWPEVPPGSETGVKLGEIKSPPLREMVRAFMKASQNLETDLVFDHVGELSRGPHTPAWETSEQLAVVALGKFMGANGIPTDVHFDEGSGLSRNNLTTAKTTVKLLQVMAAGREAADYSDALPVAGVDGTLSQRMTGTPAMQNVRAKTGTLLWANSLSGYVFTAAGEKLAFSLMLDRYDPPAGRSATDELDEIAVMLAGFQGHSNELR